MITSLLAAIRQTWGTDGVSEFLSALLGGFFAIAAQWLAFWHERKQDSKKAAEQRKALAWSIYFKISQANEAISATTKGIKDASDQARQQGMELWQVLQFPPHDWESVSWNVEELVLLLDHRLFDLMQRYQEAVWWLSNLVQSVRLYRELRVEFLRSIPSDVTGDRGVAEMTADEMRAINPTIAHLRSLALSLQEVVGKQAPAIRQLQKDFVEVMKPLAGHRPTLEFRDEMPT